MITRCTRPAALLSFFLLAGTVPAVETQADKPADRVAVGKCVTATGSMLRREAPDRPWQVVKEGETLYSGDLLIGLPGAVLDARDGAVRLTFLSDLGGITPLPIVETALTLHPAKDVDLDFTLDRGRVEFSSRTPKGKAKAIARVREGRPEITLEPGASCMLEVFGRWPAGVPFKKKAGPDHAPTLHLIFVVTNGEITLKLQRHTLAMKAPPGPAMIEWDSVHGGDPSPRKLDQLPAWAVVDDGSELAKKRRAIIDEFRQQLTRRPIGDHLNESATSDDPLRRRMAVNAMGALDDLERLGTTLATTKHPDVLENAILAMRHWIGRGPGQDQKLYEGLVKVKGHTPVDAEAIVQLLHSFGEAEVVRPELYETLIDYLGHEKLPIRTLAHWHLVRLAPAGRKIGYDPLASKEARAKAITEWQKLIPPGKLPPDPKPEEP
jgi:hypothetical protein